MCSSACKLAGPLAVLLVASSAAASPPDPFEICYGFSCKSQARVALSEPTRVPARRYSRVLGAFGGQVL